MPKLSEDTKVITLARSLGIHEGDSVEEIKAFCRRKIEGLIEGETNIETIEDIEAVVCRKLNVTVEEVWTDEDLEKLIRHYAKEKKEPVFATLKRDLDPTTFAALICLKRKQGQTENHFVAVIDCRGDKGARRFFTRWHELAHILTTVEQFELPLHRSTIERDPLEQMMDIIAGDVGFYEPLFQPLLNQFLTEEGGMSFSLVERVQSAFCPAASFQATLNACVAKLPLPALLIEAREGYKASERRAHAQGEFSFCERPIPKLRAVRVIPNSHARKAGIKIHRNMRIPKASIISTVFHEADEFSSFAAAENLNWWRSSDGAALSHLDVNVEAIKVRGDAIAIVTPGNGRAA